MQRIDAGGVGRYAGAARPGPFTNLAARCRTTATQVKAVVVRRGILQYPFWSLARARIALGRLEPGVTVVIVNWNSDDYLRACVTAIRERSPSNVRILVVDNHSADDSVAFLRSRDDVDVLRLPANLGHEVAMDIGFLSAHTEFVVSLDVDAFPIDDDWLRVLIEALETDAAVAGAHVKGGFVHPCCLAMRLSTFVERRHSFVARRSGRWAETADDEDAPGWDTGWRISLREKRRFLLDRTFVRGPGDIGSVFGGLVYHNFYSKRFDNPKQRLSDSELSLGVDAQQAAAAWSEAVRSYVPWTVPELATS